LSNQLVEFAPGEQTKTIDVTIFGDTVAEQNEEFTIGLSNATNAQIVNGSAQGMIVGDDSDVVITPIAGGSGVMFTDAAGDEVTVTLSKGSLSEANVILGADGNIVLIDLSSVAASGQGLATFDKATLKVSARGSGLVNVAAINLGSTSVKNIVINGGLGKIEGGNRNIRESDYSTNQSGFAGARGRSRERKRHFRKCGCVESEARFEGSVKCDWRFGRR
jgi:hypothetical protein